MVAVNDTRGVRVRQRRGDIVHDGNRVRQRKLRFATDPLPQRLARHQRHDEVQHARCEPWQRRLAGGCHLNRPVADLIHGSGLRLADLETGYLVAGPRSLTFHYRGHATSDP